MHSVLIFLAKGILTILATFKQQHQVTSLLEADKPAAVYSHYGYPCPHPISYLTSKVEKEPVGGPGGLGGG
jgi:hypothetical protein